MLQDEVRKLLNKIEKDLLQFVLFIRDVEKAYNKEIPENKKKSRKSPVKKREEASENASEDNTDGSAIVDAFKFVKSILLRISNLIDEFASLPTENERNLENSHSDLIRFYYSQYVYQIASYLVKLVEEHLGDFSKRLDGMALPKSETTDNISVFSKEKEMSESSVDGQSKQETPFHQDDPICLYPEMMNYKSRLKSFLSALPSDSEEYESDEHILDSSSHENLPYKHNSLTSCEDGETLIYLEILLKKLISVAKELLLHMKHVEGKIPPETRDDLVVQKLLEQDSVPQKQFDQVAQPKTGCFCKEACEKCYQSCIHKHTPSKLKKMKTCKEYRQHWLDWDPNMFPNLICEPLWMGTIPVDVEDSANASDATVKKILSNEIFSEDTAQDRKKSLEPEVRGVRDIEIQYRSTSVDSFTFDSPKHPTDSTKTPDTYELKQNLTEMSPEKTIGKITPGKHAKKISTGMLARKTPDTPKKQDKVLYNENERKSNNKTKKLSPKTSSSMELFDIDPHEKDCCEENNADFKENLEDEMKEICRSTESDPEQHFKYPHTVVFDLHTFSNRLKDKFNEYFSSSRATTENSEPVMDILFQCMDESFNYYNKEEIKDESDIYKHEKSHKHTSTNEDEDNITNEVMLDTLVNEILKVTSGEESTEDETDIHLDENGLQNIAIFPSDSDGGEYLRIKIPKLSKMQLAKREDISQACPSCVCLIHPCPNDFENEKYLAKKSLRGCCHRCWNECNRSLTIHQCHESLPSRILEVRHMDEGAKICVCYLKWDSNKEIADWRWMKSPFRDQTRVEVVQSSTGEKDTVLKVIYGMEGNMVKESLAETELKIVPDYIDKSLSATKHTSANLEELVSVSHSSSDMLKSTKLDRAKKEALKETSKSFEIDKIILTKLGRFFENLQKCGCGRGPPLILKLRKQTILNDAHNLLMAPSKISLNYYRSLRVIISDKSRKSIEATKSNFIEEDESDDLFHLFARELFNTSDMHLFEYPSEETQFLYINPEANMHHQWFQFAGTVLALAILHQKQLNVSLAMCLFKCLLDRPLNINDLKEIDPLFYQRLKWLKENDISNRIGKFCSFTVKDKIRGLVFENELIPEGKNIAVTEKNKYRYIDLAVKWKLAERCLSQLKDFRRGFAAVLEPNFLGMFSEKELQNLIRNPPDTTVLLSESSKPKHSRELTRRGTW